MSNTDAATDIKADIEADWIEPTAPIDRECFSVENEHDQVVLPYSELRLMLRA